MNTGTIWTIVGSVAAVAVVIVTVVFGLLQLRQERRRGRLFAPDPPPRTHHDPGADVTPPAERPSVQIVGHEDAEGPPVAWGGRTRAPRVWNVPTRNRGFTGRDTLLATLREGLRRGDRDKVQVLRGMGGVGKTQLAMEFAHRFASDYDIVWWIAAEQSELIGRQVATLAVALGCAPPEADTATLVRAAMAELRACDRWLLVFDNTDDPSSLRAWLPGGETGHILITSRSGGWDEIAASVEIDVFDRAESAAVLQTRVAGLSAEDADELAAELGDLPLGLAQAAQTLADTGMPAREYLGLLSTRAAEILSEGRLASYTRPLAAVTQLAADRLEDKEPIAAALLAVCAFLAPEPVPARLISAAAKDLPEPLAARAADPVALRLLFAAIGRSALARVGNDTLQMHRLTQAILRDRLTPELAAKARAESEAIVAAGDPGDRADPATWPAWAQLLPHLLAVDPANSTNPAILDLAAEATRQLWRRGDTRGTDELAGKLYEQWRHHLGDDDPHTLVLAESLGDVAWDQERYADAQKLDEDTLARRRRVLGDNHPATLTSASSLASDLRKLGKFQAARDLQEDTLARRRRVLGNDHPDTLHSVRDLAAILRELGETQTALEMDEDTLARSRTVFGSDHPDTLASASSLASDLGKLGKFQAARDLMEDTLARRRRVLGNDHPDTLHSVRDLAAILRELGETQAALEIEKDLPSGGGS
jgi:hypothetical protein